MTTDSPAMTASLIFFTLVVAAPLVEEVVFRHGLQHGLQRRLQQRWPGQAGALRAQWGTTLAFGLAHAVTRGWLLGLAVLAPAWLVGVVYQRHQRLAPCVALHALFNLGWLAMAPRLTTPLLATS